jgi:hypothetical protein
MPHPFSHLVNRIAATAALCLCLAACSGESGPPKKTCYPTKGQLFVKSQPAVGALVVLRPEGEVDLAEWFTGFPHGQVAADGSFELETYGEKDGAPAGNYVVLVTWPASSEPGNDEAPTVDRLAGRYAEPSASQFKAKVDAAPTTIPPIKIP